MTRVTEQIVETSVMFDPDVPPTIPPETTIDDYRRARERPRRSVRRWLGVGAQVLANISLADLIGSA